MKSLRKLLSLALCAAVLTCIGLPGSFAPKAAAESVAAGDVITYGCYPQTDVTASLGATLETLGGDWVSYGYCTGSGSYGSTTTADYMKYKDVVYEGKKYRGVTFDTYRPSGTEMASSATCSNYQDDNGYIAGRVYWFRFDPLQWRVIDPDAGLVLCDTVIDSQPFTGFILSDGVDDLNKMAYWGDADKTYFASDYANSGIRKWLNEDFSAAAFSDDQLANIKTTSLDNRCRATLTGTPGYGIYDAAPTEDKVFLPSFLELTNASCGFKTRSNENDPARRRAGSDYARCQGLYVTGGNAWWWTRTAKTGSLYVCAVGTSGNVEYQGYAGYAAFGVCPAMVLNELRSDDSIDLSGFDEAAFDAYKQTLKDAAGALAEEGDSEASQKLINDAKAAIDALPYDETKSLDENKAALDEAAAINSLAQALEEQRAEDKLNADKAAFDEYKQTLKDAADALAEEGDSEASQKLISDAKAAIDAVTYDENKTLDENKAALDEAAAIDSLAQALGQQRAEDKLNADKAAFDEYKQTLKDAADALAEEGDSEASQKLISDAKAAIDAVTYDENKTLDENKAALDEAAAIDSLAQALADQRAADKLNADKAAFDEYKQAQKDAADALAEEGDSEACQKLISDAKAAIDALTYDESKTLDENKAAADEAAAIDSLAQALADQRAEDKLNADKAAFDEYKQAQKDAADALAEEGDSEASRKLISDAKAAIDAVTYDETKSLDENKAELDEAAAIDSLAQALGQQRAEDKKEAAVQNAKKALCDALRGFKWSSLFRSFLDMLVKLINAVIGLFSSIAGKI